MLGLTVRRNMNVKTELDGSHINNISPGSYAYNATADV